MPPKFQSTFIPKGPIASPNISVMPKAKGRGPVDIIALVAKGIFILSVLGALGVVGYKFYLNYSIEKMGKELESLRATVSSDVVSELINLNDRISSAKELDDNRRVLSPVFAYLEAGTPKTVRFTQFNFTNGESGPQIFLRGEAASYSALALESQIIEKSKNFKDPVFSDIRLDDRGNVTFSLKAGLVKDLLSYKNLKFVTPSTSSGQAATSTATTTQP